MAARIELSRFRAVAAKREQTLREEAEQANETKVGCERERGEREREREGERGERGEGS